MHRSTIFTGLCITALFFLLVADISITKSSAGEEPGIGHGSELQAIVSAAQEMGNRLTHMESLLQTLVHPVWEYKLVEPNILNTSEMGKQCVEGVDMAKLGKEGWELVSYTDHYGFIFKRKRKEK